MNDNKFTLPTFNNNDVTSLRNSLQGFTFEKSKERNSSNTAEMMNKSIMESAVRDLEITNDCKEVKIRTNAGTPNIAKKILNPKEVTIEYI